MKGYMQTIVAIGEGPQRVVRGGLGFSALAAMSLLVLLVSAPAGAQTMAGSLTATDESPEPFSVHPPLAGGGAALWSGGTLIFPAESTSGQIYRSVQANLSATVPQCHSGNVQLTLSVRVQNNGPNSAFGYAGAFRLLGPPPPANWGTKRVLAETGVPAGAAPGPQHTLIVSAQVPAADLAAGEVSIHLALETGQSGSTKQWTADQFQASYTFGTGTCEAEIDIDKTATGPDPLVAGSTIDYQFAVSNPGDFTLSNVSVIDPLPGMSPISCPGTTLVPGANMTCAASYTVTPADVGAGIVANTATAMGTPSNGAPNVTDEDSTTMPPSQVHSVDLEKTASVPNASGVVMYSFEVTNTGNVTLTSVGVTDPLAGLSAISCPGTSLAPSVSMTCTATRTLTQADIAAGSVTNTATATGTPPSGPAVSDQDSATVGTAQAALISLTKTGGGPNPLTAGSTVSYSFLVANVGQLMLTGISVTDPLPGLPGISCPGTTLAPGASMTCTASYTVTQADASAGAIVNTATAQGTPPNGLSSVSDQSSATVPPVASPLPVSMLPVSVLVTLMLLLAATAIWQLRQNGRMA